MLSGKKILLGVSGGIAAYKACEIVSRLKKQGAEVRVILTEHAAQFVPETTFEALSGNPVGLKLFGCDGGWEIRHVRWPQGADLFIVAPATANVLAKMANGIADDLLTSSLLAATCPVLAAPAMNTAMWRHPATRQNLATLAARGVKTVGPGSGHLACGDSGDGRMSEAAEIVEAADRLLSAKRDLEGIKVLVTAGPTREPVDPVRFLTNQSSGKMGYAIAKAARDRGADVTLVTGPVAIPAPAGVKVVPVETTEELFDAVTGRCEEQDVIVQAAAPADFRAERAEHKIKKQGDAPLTLTLYPTPDVAAAVGAKKREGQFIVAFAAETQNLLENARKKLGRKNASLVVANDVTRAGAGFGTDTNVAAFVTAQGVRELPMMTKRELADKILDEYVSGKNS